MRARQKRRLVETLHLKIFFIFFTQNGRINRAVACLPRLGEGGRRFGPPLNTPLDVQAYNGFWVPSRGNPVSTVQRVDPLRGQKRSPGADILVLGYLRILFALSSL